MDYKHIDVVEKFSKRLICTGKSVYFLPIIKNTECIDNN